MWNRLKLSRRKSSQAGQVDDLTCLTSHSGPQPEPGSSSSDTNTFPTSVSYFDTSSRHKADTGTLLDKNPQLLNLSAPLRPQQHRSLDTRNDPFGLVVLHKPHSPLERVVDILFIHGLGGTALRTWCFNRDLENLWPQLWLPKEDGFDSARILTYGYNAHFSTRNEKSTLAIGDFANELLFRMKHSESGDQRLGQVPIIVVAHSMGGLLFKKAYMQGLENQEFREIISQIKAVLFLATPHRGTDLADTLNKVLSTSVFGHTAKDYVAELARRSGTIDVLNDSFRHYASKLKIFSFYETLATAHGPLSIMIVPKDSAILGYPDEMAIPLIANHHDVCKFKSTKDSNYTSVVSALRSVVSSNTSTAIGEGDIVAAELKAISVFLEMESPPEEDLAALRAERRKGTCEDFIASGSFGEWRTSTHSQIFWVHAPPGSGKSTLSSMVIDRLIDDGEVCSYFFFKYGHLQKRTTSSMLRSMAYQMASQDSIICHALAKLADSGTTLQSATTATLWKKLYLDVIYRFDSKKDVFWVIDAIDEAESGRQIIEHLSAVATFKTRIHILILSRHYPEIGVALQRVGRKVDVVISTLPANDLDIRLAVADEIEYLHSDDDDFKGEIVNEITKRARGNFLWATLVVKRVAACHRREQIRSALEATPDGMDNLYDRMLNEIVSLNMAEEDLSLAKIILSWVLYGRTPLTIEELSEPYHNVFSSVMDLKHTIEHVCGRFVTIGTNNSISLLHHSAREYLKRSVGSRLSLDLTNVHEELLHKCLIAICDNNLKSQLRALKVPQFLRYAATSWAFHLENCSTQSDRVLNGLIRFFKGPFPLTWIHYLAMRSQLVELPGISRRLMAYVHKRRKVETDRPPRLHYASDLLLIENWATDLLKIAVKFSRNLSEDPFWIYNCIPALSPSSSAIFQRFSTSSASTLSVSGTLNEEWDDCLARVSGGHGKALRLASSALHLAVAIELPRGEIILWDTTLLVIVRSFNINQRVSMLCFNNSGSLLACYGASASWVWQMKTGSIVMTAPNPYMEQVIEMKYDEQDTLMIVTDIRRVYRLTPGDESSNKARWVRLSPDLLEELAIPDGVFLGTPTSVAFNSDCSHIAVVYKGFPPAVWSIDPPCVVARLKRKHEKGRPAYNSYTGDSRIVWNPTGTHIFGIYGDIFKWALSDDKYTIAQDDTGVIPHTMQCSPNGLVIITGDVQGSIKIYEVSSMSMIYKLTSEDGTNNISFSPDSLRFYDLRGSYCNVWEPNCLMRVADAASKKLSELASSDDSFWSDTEDTSNTSISFPASESHAVNRPAIMAIAAQSTSDGVVVYSCDDGSVLLHDSRNDETHTIKPPGSRPLIQHLAYNTRQGILAVSDVYGTLRLKQISKKNGLFQVDDTHENDKAASIEGSTRQLILADSGDYLLVSSQKGSHVFTLQDGSLKCKFSISTHEDARWLQHPSKPHLLISLTVETAIIYNWNLKELNTVALSMNIYELTTGPFIVDSILTSHCSRLLLIRTTSKDHTHRNHGFAVLATAQFIENPKMPSYTPVETYQPSQTLVNAIWQPIGILPDSRLAFFDRGLHLCTALLHGEENIKRHFFVPHDWVTASGIELCWVWGDGTLLCPTKGRVALIRSDVIAKW